MHVLVRVGAIWNKNSNNLLFSRKCWCSTATKEYLRAKPCFILTSATMASPPARCRRPRTWPRRAPPRPPTCPRQGQCPSPTPLCPLSTPPPPSPLMKPLVTLWPTRAASTNLLLHQVSQGPFQGSLQATELNSSSLLFTNYNVILLSSLLYKLCDEDSLRFELRN